MKKTIITICLSPDIVAKVDRLAKTERMSRSWMIERIVEQYNK